MGCDLTMPDRSNESYRTRREILDAYYSEVYQKYLFERDLQGMGIRYFERAVEKFWKIKAPNRVLEIGGGSGEHLPYVSYEPKISYTLLDLRRPTNKHSYNISSALLKKVSYLTGDAQNIPFVDNHFDRVLSTCLLHHVDDVLTVLQEVRRVTSKGGEIAFLMPTDPGIFNRFIKKAVSYPKLSKISSIKPELYYALDHKNHIASILEQVKYVFQNDIVEFHYRPFYFKSWNLNLLVVAAITRT